MDLILKGIATGLILSIMIGPSFFVLLETSIRKGVRAALAFDLGVLVSDLVYILIAYVFYNQVSEFSSGENNSMLHLIGGILFCGYGTYNLLKKFQEIKIDSKLHVTASTRSYVLLSLKGLLLNFANPLVVFYWFSVLTLGTKTASDGNETYSIIIFLSAILITFFAVDILKIFGAKRLRPLITPQVLKGLNKLIGIVFLVFGGVLIIQGILGFYK